MEGLRASRSDVEYLTDRNGLEALRALKTAPVEVVVTDLRMPEMDGLELLEHMRREHPGIPVLVMSAYGTPTVEEQVRALGSATFFGKPLDIREVSDRIFEIVDAGATGHLHGLSLPTFLQAVEMERKTCTLEVISGAETGKLYVSDGELIHAELGDLEGIQAATTLLCWSRPDISISTGCNSEDRTIRRPLQFVLMEACRLQDEGRRPSQSSAERESGAELDIGGACADERIQAAAGGTSDTPRRDSIPGTASTDSILDDEPGIEAWAVVDEHGNLLKGNVEGNLQLPALAAFVANHAARVEPVLCMGSLRSSTILTDDARSLHVLRRAGRLGCLLAQDHVETERLLARLSKELDS